MKKASVLFGISIIFLAACSDENNDSNEANAQNDETGGEESAEEQNAAESENGEEDLNEAATAETEINDIENNNSEINNQESENEDNDENEEGEEAAEEEAEVKYEIREDSSIGPIDDADESVVLLTIDDAPDKHGVEMAEKLTELNADAIFFVNGHFIDSEEGKAELQAIYDMGFEIGNHTMTHPNLTDISEEQTYEEIIGLNDLIEDVIGERPRFFRAPFGMNSDHSAQIMEEEDMQAMNWSYGYDFIEGYMEADALAEIMVEAPELRDGANLLMHDRAFTLEALDDIISGLEDKGYDFVNPDEIK